MHSDLSLKDKYAMWPASRLHPPLFLSMLILLQAVSLKSQASHASRHHRYVRRIVSHLNANFNLQPSRRVTPQGNLQSYILGSLNFKAGSHQLGLAFDLKPAGSEDRPETPCLFFFHGPTGLISHNFNQNLTQLTFCLKRWGSAAQASIDLHGEHGFSCAPRFWGVTSRFNFVLSHLFEIQMSLIVRQGLSIFNLSVMRHGSGVDLLKVFDGSSQIGALLSAGSSLGPKRYLEAPSASTSSQPHDCLACTLEVNDCSRKEAEKLEEKEQEISEAFQKVEVLENQAPEKQKDAFSFKPVTLLKITPCIKNSAQKSLEFVGISFLQIVKAVLISKRREGNCCNLQILIPLQNLAAQPMLHEWFDVGGILQALARWPLGSCGALKKAIDPPSKVEPSRSHHLPKVFSMEERIKSYFDSTFERDAPRTLFEHAKVFEFQNSQQLFSVLVQNRSLLEVAQVSQVDFKVETDAPFQPDLPLTILPHSSSEAVRLKISPPLCLRLPPMPIKTTSSPSIEHLHIDAFYRYEKQIQELRAACTQLLQKFSLTNLQKVLKEVERPFDPELSSAAKAAETREEQVNLSQRLTLKSWFSGHRPEKTKIALSPEALECLLRERPFAQNLTIFLEDGPSRPQKRTFEKNLNAFIHRYTLTLDQIELIEANAQWIEKDRTLFQKRFKELLIQDFKRDFLKTKRTIEVKIKKTEQWRSALMASAFEKSDLTEASIAKVAPQACNNSWQRAQKINFCNDQLSILKKLSAFFSMGDQNLAARSWHVSLFQGLKGDERLSQKQGAVGLLKGLFKKFKRSAA